MQFLNRKPSSMLVLVLVMLLLLCILATLQYRWSGQISQAESERMQRNLNTSASGFSQEFDREITRAYSFFQIEAAESNEQSSAQLKERFRIWNSAAPYPQIISEVYLAEKDSKKNVQLSRYDKDREQLKQTDWPDELKSIQYALGKESSTSNKTSEIEGVHELPFGNIEPIEPNIPALVIPLMPDVLISNKEAEPQRIPFHQFDNHIIVKLNADFLRSSFLPTLANKYFSGTGGLDYNIKVFNINSQTAFFHTNPQQSTNAARGDITTDIFRIRIEEMPPMFLIRANVQTPKTTGTAIWTNRIERFQVKHRESPVGEDFEIGTIKDKEKGKTTTRIFNRVKRNDFTTKTIVQDELVGGWKLMVWHRTGSLETFIANARRRNIMISFSVLVLLAVSIGVIILATRRSQLLAQRQLEFVSSVSHEFRTPLAVICSAGENMADGIVASSAQVSKYGELVLNEGRRLSEMVEQVLEFAGAQKRRRSRRMPLEFRPIKVEKVIAEALTVCGPLLTEKNFKVETQIEKDLPLINADERSLSRALQNLIGNAIKYDVDRRSIIIKASSVENKKNKEIIISVADKGRGIGSDEIAHLFEPFYRGRAVVAEQIHGNGLGLSLVKQTLMAHKGRVTVTSDMGVGSVFSIHLPAIIKATEVNESVAHFKQDVKAYTD